MISVEKKSPIFFNHSFDKKRLKALISWVFKKSGEEEALRVLDLLKETGFNNATKAGISIGLHDLTTPATKSWLISESQQSINTAYRDFNGAKITATERSQRIIDTWHRASESLSKQVVEYFGIYDTFNPVYIMALSGARGNFSQVRQLIGMRGLMADQQGKIVSFPIRSNLREGLTITEYFISCSGARKGLVDTALRTADTGYLTRRLVDVSHHVVVKRIRCNTERGIALRDLQSYNKILLSLKERLIGRVLAETIVEKDRVRLPHDVRHECLIAKKDREITPALALQITRHRNQVLIRSPLTCSFTHEVCQLCYGWSISQGSLVSLGDAVGVIAAQSIGEPGTQLTMRTFHTGGVFSGDLLQEVRAPHAGRIEFSQAFQGLLIRTGHGRIAFLSKTSGSLILNDLDNLHHVHDQSSGSDSPRVSQVYQAEFSKTENNKQEILAENLSEGTKSTLKESQNLQKNKLPDSTIIPIQPFTMLFVRQGERVEMNQLLAEFSIQNKEGNQPIKTEQTLFAELSGKIIEDCSGKTYIKYLKESSLLLDYLRDYMSRWADYSYHATLDKAHTNLKSTDLTPSYPVSASSQVSPSAFTFSASHPQESLVNASAKPCIAKGDVYKTDRIRLPRYARVCYANPCVARHELGKQACDSQKEYNVSDRCFTNASQIERSSKKQNFTQNSFYKNFGESNKKLFKNKENKPKIQDISKIQLLPSYRSEDLETDLFRQIEPVQSGRLGFLKILSTRIGATFDYTCPIKSKNLENYLQNSLFLSQQQQKFKQIDLLSFGAIPSFKASTYTPDYSTSSVYKNTFENSLFYPVGTKRIRKFRDSRNFKKHEVLSTGFIRQKNSSIPTKYLHPAFVKENRFVLQTIAEYGDIVDEEYKTKTKIL